MAFVLYNEKPIVPAPLYSLNESIKRTADGTPISVEYTIVLSGAIVACKGSPNSSGGFGTDVADESCSGDDAKFQNITKKQNVLRNLFQEDGKKLEIQSHDGDQLVTCYPKVNSVVFSSDVNVEKSDYSITLVAHELVGVEGVGYPTAIKEALRYNLDNLTENVSMTEEVEYDEDGAELPFFNVTYTVSARSAKTYNETDTTLPGPHSLGPTGQTNTNPGFVNARTAVQALADTEGFSSGMHLYDLIASSEYFVRNGNIGNFNVVDNAVTETGDWFEGSYGITRSFQLRSLVGSVCASHDYTVDVSKNRPIGHGYHGYENIYTINGTIQGYKKSGTTAYKEANSFFNTNIYDAKSYNKVIALIHSVLSPNSNLSAEPKPITSNVSINKRSGTISYSYTFKENVTKGNFADGNYFADFSLKVSDTHDDEKVAVIPILGRAEGPIIQDLQTTGVFKRNISGTFILKQKNTSSINNSYPWTYKDINSFREEAVKIMKDEAVGIFKGSDETYFMESWTDGLDAFSGTYDINCTLIYKRTEDDAVADITGSGWFVPDIS